MAELQGLSSATLKHQVSTIASILAYPRGRALSTHPHVCKFLKGVALLILAPVSRSPSSDLTLVLKALKGHPFEPMVTCPLRELSQKTAVLTGITSARRVSKLASFLVVKDLCSFQEDRVVLRTDPTFLPKVNSIFDLLEEVTLLSFRSNPKHLSEQ